MKHLYLITTLAFGSGIRAWQWLRPRANATNGSWTQDQFKNFVLFGDSYSDENRDLYFLQHNGSAPPTGTLFNESLQAADGGRIWARYVVQYTNEALTLYNYAVDGASCSNSITPRGLNATLPLYPDIDGYEVPAFLADKELDVNIATGGPYFDPPLTDENTVYTIWIGTNDISIFFTDAQVLGKTLTDYVDCTFTQMDRIYASGARYFVLFNVAPLQLASLWANASEGGETPSYFWQDKPSNLTDIAEKMTEWTTSLNMIWDYRTPVEVLLNERYPGAKVALFDVNRIVCYRDLEDQIRVIDFADDDTSYSIFTTILRHTSMGRLHCSQLDTRTIVI